MHSEILTVNGIDYVRKNRAVAKALWECGFTVWMCPSNLHPFGIMEMAQANRSDGIKSFDAVEDRFRSSNCNSKAGRWIKYFVLQSQIS